MILYFCVAYSIIQCSIVGANYLNGVLKITNTLGYQEFYSKHQDLILNKAYREKIYCKLSIFDIHAVIPYSMQPNR